MEDTNKLRFEPTMAYGTHIIVQTDYTTTQEYTAPTAWSFRPKTKSKSLPLVAEYVPEINRWKGCLGDRGEITEVKRLAAMGRFKPCWDGLLPLDGYVYLEPTSVAFIPPYVDVTYDALRRFPWHMLQSQDRAVKVLVPRKPLLTLLNYDKLRMYYGAQDRMVIAVASMGGWSEPYREVMVALPANKQDEEDGPSYEGRSAPYCGLTFQNLCPRAGWFWHDIE